MINCPKARSRLPAPRTLSMGLAGTGARATTPSSHRPLLAGGVEGKVFICTGVEVGGASGSAWACACASAASLDGTAS